MNILKIYETYTIPPNLQRHMIEVGAVGEFVTNHWKGPKLDKQALIQALLLHDLGNIVKFKKPFVGELQQNAKYWESVQQKFIQRYGTNAHTMTNAIIQELGVADSVRTILSDADRENQFEWEAKIVDFSDLCVSPKGIVGIEERYLDFMKRYNRTADDPKLMAWKKRADEVTQYITVDVSEIPHHDFSEAIQKLRKTDIPLAI